MLGRSNLLAAVALALSAMAPAGTQTARQNQCTTNRRVLMQGLYGANSNAGNCNHSTGPGWSHAQVKRMAKKRKNQQRNKLAHRRAGA